ncbi:SagB/ThcOx family dehydrogenase [Falsirhodobacter xinxiangensis]|uniref:SagB/ThcOx family dehydrogenase n=1 Tax=Falsirhodobacter xinxiangensis TaxID=2530049 RepID=UPI0010A9A307|nr:SagB/ThcOx family dehydrogenase [Rhodobacter xinxiangensis]
MSYWNPLVTIRPNKVEPLGEVQISDASEQKRYRMRKQDLLDALFSDKGLGKKQLEALTALDLIGPTAESKTASATGSLNHWKERNWALALSYYHWSIRDTFLDEGENYEDLRCNALKQMLVDKELPLPELVDASENSFIGAPAPIPPKCNVGDVLASRKTTLSMTSNGELTSEILHGLLANGFSVSRRYHVPDVEEHIHNILHGVGFAFDPYIAIFDVPGLEAGIYFYSISQDRLRLNRSGLFRQEICKGLIGHEQALTAACTILLTADFRRFQWRYRHERALRNLYFDVGRMAQYLLVIATAYGVKTHITPATVDDYLADILGLDRDAQQVFHTVTLGF